jgi:nucleoside-diphosphate-sugar epimerase
MTVAGARGRAVVTGASGFLGRRVAAALAAAGWAVIGVDRAPAPPGAPWAHEPADAADEAALVALTRGAALVVHAAAIPRPGGLAPAEVFGPNVAAAFAAVEAAARSAVARLVYVSSFAVYGFPFFERPRPPAWLPVDETHPTAPQDAYALSKLVGEEIIAAAVRRGRLSAVSLRLPWIHDAASFARDIPPRIASGRAADDLWAWIDVLDAADAVLAAAQARTEGHLVALAAAAETYMDADTAVLAAAAFPATPLRLPLRGRASSLDGTLARRALGFAPTRGRPDRRGPG